MPDNITYIKPEGELFKYSIDLTEAMSEPDIHHVMIGDRLAVVIWAGVRTALFHPKGTSVLMLHSNRYYHYGFKIKSFK